MPDRYEPSLDEYLQFKRTLDEVERVVKAQNVLLGPIQEQLKRIEDKLDRLLAIAEGYKPPTFVVNEKVKVRQGYNAWWMKEPGEWAGWLDGTELIIIGLPSLDRAVVLRERGQWDGETGDIPREWLEAI